MWRGAHARTCVRESCAEGRLPCSHSHALFPLSFTPAGAARVNWAAEVVPDSERRKLTHDARALPRLLELVATARKKAASEGAGGAVPRAGSSSGTPPASSASPPASK